MEIDLNPGEAFVDKIMEVFWSAPPMCEQCAHERVCKYKDSRVGKCSDFKNLNYVIL